MSETVPSGSRRSEAGFTLIETIIAIAIFIGVSGLIYRALQMVQGTSRAQSERSALQANLRSAVSLLTAELGELQVNTTGGTSDIATLSDTSVRYRAMRATGMTCSVSVNDVVIRNSGGALSSSRTPVAGRDSLLLFADGDTLTTNDDQWLRLPILATPSSSTCPDGTTGLRVITAVPNPLIVYVPGPIRTFEVMELSKMQSGGSSWLGGRSISAGQALAPVLGPVNPGSGVRFSYLDLAGSSTTSPTAVRQVFVTILGATSQAINDAGTSGPGSIRNDSLQVHFTVRNSQ